MLSVSSAQQPSSTTTTASSSSSSSSSTCNQQQQPSSTPSTRRNSSSNQQPYSPQSSSSGYSSSSSRSTRAGGGVRDPTLSNSRTSSNNTSPPAGTGSSNSRPIDSDFHFNTTDVIHRFTSSTDQPSLSPTNPPLTSSPTNPISAKSSHPSPHSNQEMSIHRIAPPTSASPSHNHPNYPSRSATNGSHDEWQQNTSGAGPEEGEASSERQPEVGGWNQDPAATVTASRSPATKTRKMGEGGSRQQGPSPSSSIGTGGGGGGSQQQEAAQYLNGSTSFQSAIPSSSSSNTPPTNSTGEYQPGNTSSSSTHSGSRGTAALSPPGREQGKSPQRESSSTNSSNRSSRHRNQSQSPSQSQQVAAPGGGGHGQYASSSYSEVESSAASSPVKASSRSTRGMEPTSENTPETPHLDLASYPTQDLLRVLATLLHQIATANDELRPGGGGNGIDDKNGRGKSRDKSRDPSSSNSGVEAENMTRSGSSGNEISSSRSPRRSPASATTAALGALSTPSSTLCFHARNVPSISIESYLVRILKYCPTTNEVFLSLLVYFDRMSRMSTGASPGRSSHGGERPGRAAGLPDGNNSDSVTLDGDTRMRSGSEERRSREGMEVDGNEDDEGQEPHPGMRGFAIDSYNVHRLVIAGVTVASKFFSDVFYTNSRYAKVSAGGLC